MSGLPKELEPLARLFEKDEPRVLVVVGAGVSIGATGAKQASWRGLLEHGLDYRAAKQYIPEERRCELYASLKAAFDPFNVNKALRHRGAHRTRSKDPGRPGLHRLACCRIQRLAGEARSQ